MPATSNLRLLPPSLPEPLAGTCRVIGCSMAITDPLGFCADCLTAYDRHVAHVADRARLAVDLVRAASPELFGTLDRLNPGLGDRLAAHLAAYVSAEPGAPLLSLQGLDDFLAEIAPVLPWRAPRPLAP